MTNPVRLIQPVVQPTHLGEALVEAILRESGFARRVLDLPDNFSRVQREVVIQAPQGLTLDGRHKVDVAVWADNSDQCAAIEVKLGTSSKYRNVNSFLTKLLELPTRESTRARLKGSVPAILNLRDWSNIGEHTGAIQLKFKDRPRTVQLPWFLVVRESLANHWNVNKNEPGSHPDDERRCIVVTLESLAKEIPPSRFNEIVREALGPDPWTAWGMTTK